MGTFSFSDLIRRGAQAVKSIARGIGAGYSGASSGGYGGAYGFGYWLGSGARAGAKMVAAAVEVVKKVVTVKTAVAAPKPSSTGGIEGSSSISWFKQLDWTTANAIYNYGRGKINVTVPASSISGLSGLRESNFDESGIYATNLWFNPGASMNDRLVYGGISLENLGNGSAKITRDTYDFNQMEGLDLMVMLRNAGTAGGELAAYGTSGRFGRPYNIYFTGTVPVANG